MYSILMSKKSRKMTLQTIKDGTDRLSTEVKAGLAALTGLWMTDCGLPPKIESVVSCSGSCMIMMYKLE